MTGDDRDPAPTPTPTGQPEPTPGDAEPTEPPAAPGPPEPRRDPLAPNVLIVARREYFGLVRRRVFRISTIALAALAVALAFLPVFFRAIDQATLTTIGIAAADRDLAVRADGILEGVLNGGLVAPGSDRAAYDLQILDDPDGAIAAVEDGRLDAALIADRAADGRLDFRFYTGEGVGADRLQIVAMGSLAVAMLDWTSQVTITGGQGFSVPTFESISASGPSAGGAPLSGAEFAGRRIVGIVFVVLIFITLVIYGMWVAAGVAAEKSTRVMELLVSAASARQLIIGKVLGIGLAGATQYVGVLLPAVVALLIQERVGDAILGAGQGIAPTLSALSPALLLTFFLYFALGFTLYALIYAAAGSLVSRVQDVNQIALPLSLIAIAGYAPALLALTGGTGGFIRLASFVPFWSPFVMVTRLSVGRVEPIEVIVSLGLLAASIPLALLFAVRIYAAGVLLYGQRPGLRRWVEAAFGR